MSADTVVIAVVGGGTLLYAIVDEVTVWREDRAEEKQHEIELRAARAEFRATLDLRDADQRGLAG